MEHSKNTIAVIGGSGKTGKYLIRQLLVHGYRIRALIRNAERFHIQHHAIEMIIGDVSNEENVKALIRGCDAVISVLGLGVPPSGLSIFSSGTRNILKAMNSYSVGRYIAITGLNVSTPSDKKGSATQYATDWMYKNYPISTVDRQLEYSLLAGSTIDWTLVRLPRIEQTGILNEISVSLTDCPGDKISATSLAEFLISQLDDNTFLKKAPFAANT